MNGDCVSQLASCIEDAGSQEVAITAEVYEVRNLLFFFAFLCQAIPICQLASGFLCNYSFFPVCFTFLMSSSLFDLLSIFILFAQLVRQNTRQCPVPACSLQAPARS